jgi:hypothetical protein
MEDADVNRIRIKPRWDIATPLALLSAIFLGFSVFARPDDVDDPAALSSTRVSAAVIGALMLAVAASLILVPWLRRHRALVLEPVEARQLRLHWWSRSLQQQLPVAGPWPFLTQPAPGEAVHFRSWAIRRDFYGTDAWWNESTLFIGGPALGLATLAVSSLANSSRRSAALAAAAPRWREDDRGMVYITSHRLIFTGRRGTHGGLLAEIVQLHESDGGGLFLRFFDGSTLELQVPADPIALALLVRRLLDGHIEVVPPPRRTIQAAGSSRPILDRWGTVLAMPAASGHR